MSHRRMQGGQRSPLLCGAAPTPPVRVWYWEGVTRNEMPSPHRSSNQDGWACNSAACREHVVYGWLLSRPRGNQGGGLCYRVFLGGGVGVLALKMLKWHQSISLMQPSKWPPSLSWESGTQHCNGNPTNLRL